MLNCLNLDLTTGFKVVSTDYRNRNIEWLCPVDMCLQRLQLSPVDDGSKWYS